MIISPSTLRAAALLPLLGVASSCVTARYTPTGVAYPARSADCAIEVFSSAPPAREYEEIGIIEGKGTHWKANLEDMLPKVKEEACFAGGHAVILNSANRYVTGEEGLEDENLYAVATVIRWAQG